MWGKLFTVIDIFCSILVLVNHGLRRLTRICLTAESSEKAKVFLDVDYTGKFKLWIFSSP